MADKIQNAYETSKNIYDDVLTQRNIFSKLYIKLFWSGTDDNDIARKVLAYVPDDFSGNLLDVPVGTAVFTENKWSSLKNAHMNSTIVEYIEGIEVIKAFGRAGTSYEKYAKAILDYKKFVVKWLSSTWITMKMTFALFPSTLLGTLPVGLYLTMHGQLTISQLVLAVMLSMSMVTSFAKIEVFSENLREMQYNIESIQDYLTMKEFPEPSVYANINSYDVKLENVHFSYTGEEKDEVLHGIDLTMPAGSFTALVGPSGGGKSTVARLISRFWDVTSGGITIGGVNIREMPLSQLSEMISFVTQDNFLFRCSIMENIRLGNPAASDEEVKEAARKACCQEFIEKLPQGYEAHVVPRSSTLKNFGIIQTIHCGIIDESYCGDNDQWYFPAYALRDTEIHVNDRICQFRIMEHQPTIQFEETEKLTVADRGGIGSTGVQ